MRVTAASLIASALVCWPGMVLAQERDIVVTAERLTQQAEDYAATVAVAPRGSDQYARWGDRLCPRVAGLTAEAAQALIDHIARRAYQVGVEAEREGCAANLIIVFAPEARAFAQEVVASRRELLGYYQADDTTTEGRAALAAFANSDRPVRWWHISRTTTADGNQLGDPRSRTGRRDRAAQVAAMRHSRSSSIQTNNQELTDGLLAGNGVDGAEGIRSQGSRLRGATRQDLSFALVIIDADQAAAHPASAVADYLAMATLVQVNPDADMSRFPSILNLFGSAAPAQSMTAWDLAYLQGLYSATREAASSRRQRAEIARRMVDQVGGATQR